MRSGATITAQWPGKTVGIAVFDHPSNPRHPTTWHVRDYGLFAANPLGCTILKRKTKGLGICGSGRKSVHSLSF